MKTLNIGMIGYKFMGNAHSNAWRQVDKFFPVSAQPVLHTADDVERSAEDGDTSGLVTAAFICQHSILDNWRDLTCGGEGPVSTTTACR